MYIKFIKFWKILFDILKLSGVPNASLAVLKSIIVFCIGALLEIITLSMIAPIAFAIITNKPLKLGVFQIDGLFANTSINKIWLFIGLFVFLTIGLISKLLCQFYITRLSAYFGSNISKRIFTDLLQAKYSYSSTVEHHKIFTTFTQKLELTVQTLALYFRILSNLIISLGIIIISIGIAGINFTIILTIGFVCLNSLIVYVIRKRTKRYSEFTKINIDFAQEQINNVLGNLEIIKLRSVNFHLSQSYNTSVKNYRYSLATSDFLSTSPRIITESFLIFAILSGLLIYKLTVSIESPILLLEVLGTFLVLSQRLLPSVTQISGGINAIIARKPAVLSLLDMSNLLRENSEYDGFSTGLPLNRNSLVNVQSNSTYLQDQNNSLDINIIDLVYRDQNNMLIFDGLNAVIPHGQTTSIIGPSGSGKSTLVKLISGLLIPLSGKITYNGLSINPPQRYDDGVIWRNKIGYASQNPFLFNSTIKENILFGADKEVSNDLFDKAIEVSGVLSMLKTMPYGLQTKCGNGGNFLSGGQKQRVSIARALIHAEEILVMDESTTGIESGLEQYILRSIQSLGITIILISHDPKLHALSDHTIKLS